MKASTALVSVSFALGIAGLLSLTAAHLALTDIAHGESDLRMEWTVVRFAWAMLFTSQVTTLAALWSLFRSTRPATHDKVAV